MKFRRLKHGVAVKMTGVEKIALYFMWVRGEMWSKRKLKKGEPYRNTLMRPKNKEDEKREEMLRRFMHKHHISFFWKSRADLDDIQFRFTKGFTLGVSELSRRKGLTVKEA
jgi:hypothetical protein